MFPCELSGSSGVTLTSCGRDMNEVSIACCMPSENKDSNVEYKAGQFNNSCSKLWRKFIQWIRHERVNTVKYFKAE